MTSDRGLLSSVYQSTSKYVPSPQTKELILNYFKYNNFQDFNTWQQIARARIEYEYQEAPKRFVCTITLRWDDRVTPHIRAQAVAHSKKTAKRKALVQIIEVLICQGYIARGFKQENFVDRLPRRRKNQSDQSGDEGQQEEYKGRSQLIRMLQQNQRQAILSLTLPEDKPFKHLVLYQCWNYGLRQKSINLLSFILKVLSGNVQNQDEMEAEEEGEVQRLDKRQLFESSEVKPPLPEDLTDFIRSYYLQQPVKSGIVRQPRLSVEVLPSEKVLMKAYTPSPSRQQLLQYFHPIQATSLILQRQKPKTISFLGDFEKAQLPCFQRQQLQVNVRLVELLYSLLLFYAQDLEFCLKVLTLLENHLFRLSITFPRRLSYTLRQSAELYYLKHKNLLTAQFIQLLSGRIANCQSSTAIEGMLYPIQGEQHYYQFKPKEPEEIVAKKLRRSNYSQFQQAQQISHKEMVLLISKLSGRWVAEVIELSPAIKLHAPAFPDDFNDPHPATLFKLCNAKLFQKTSSALIEASINCLQLLSNNTFLLWQPPGYAQLSLMAELLLEWQNSRQSVLIATPNPQQVANQLAGLGFKVIKLAPKTEQKMIPKSNIIVASPQHACCDLLRNYAFSRVLVQSAHAISEISLLHAIVKDCKQLWLIGDPFLPRMHINSDYCRERSWNMSLMQRLYKEGKFARTYESIVQLPTLHNNVLQWANEYVYGKKLKLLGSQSQLPVVKGFPWPSYEHRVCFLHESSFHPLPAYFHRISQICALIVEQVIRSGYTKPEQIGCLSSSMEILSHLRWHVAKLLPRAGVTDLRLLNKLLGKMVRLVSGSRYVVSEMSILVVSSGRGGVGDILGSLLEGRRGVVLIGDCNELSKSPDWNQFLGWCKENQLIMSFHSDPQ